MFVDTIRLKTEQLIRNRLWRHSIEVNGDVSHRSEAAELIRVLVAGLAREEEGRLRPYVLLREGAIDRHFFHAIERAESPRLPLTGDFGSSVDGHWQSAPMVFELRDPRLLTGYVSRYWGDGGLSLFFSTLEPIEFFSLVRSLPVIRSEGASCYWAPFWDASSMEKLLCQSGQSASAELFRHIDYYLVEGDQGNRIRVYCRGDS